ncbi:MAG TPA: hypothetical protein VGB82_25970 [Alphaproteobacteria bacterium]
MPPIHQKIRLRLASTLRQHTAKLEADFRQLRSHLLTALNLLIALEARLPGTPTSDLRCECQRLLGGLEYVKEKPDPAEINRLAAEVCGFSEALAALG